MKVFFTVIGFSLLTIGFFAGFSNLGIPQIEPAPPPVEEKFDLGAMTMDQFVGLGERIFKGKGTCTLCHNAVGGRAPLLDKAASLAKERMADARYKGEAKTVEDYLLESLVEPSAYVVAGFGKAGSNDTESPMPNVLGGSVRLSEAEAKSVVAYLQQLSGAEITVKIPAETKKEEEAAPEEGEPRPPFKKVEEVIGEFACGACHKVGTEAGEQGPDLRKIGAIRDRNSLRHSILDPNAEISTGFKPDLMPKDYGAQLYASELELLVDYLAALK